MDLNVLCKKPRKPSGKSAPAAGPESTQPEVEVIHAETLAKRPVGSSVPDQVRKDDEGYYVLQMVDWTPRGSSATMQAQWPNISYQAKAWDNPEATTEFSRGVLHPTLAKDLHTLPSEVLIARAVKQIMLVSHTLGLIIFAFFSLSFMKEQRADRRKADDKLLKLMRNESLKAELPGKSITDYKQSVRFGWGLRWIGQVSYEYGYRVALARFQARYPDLEVDNKPFTKQPEDSSVPMKTHQEFDDSIPPEE
ncbi:hypothetical protein B296_00040613 [Ensete ventricosum]|uniref:Uncharacterized protein n=1 Tax=Ensete ventricosum TaxID=4639 RepID=A0A426YE75_ENSVE|nr:hypothetical protein B296_00040613 [Ensete ventricosum]